MAVFHTSAFIKSKRLGALILELCLDALLPQSKEVKELEKSTSSDFSSLIFPAPANRNLFSLLPYRHPKVETLIWEIKYRGNPRLTALGARIIYDALIPELEEKRMWENFTDPVLVAIPLSKERLRERGFNQVDNLASALVSLDNNVHFSYCPKALRKVRHTESQTKAKSKVERLSNLKGCFEADAESVKNRNIILLDDVSTTGATLEEASRQLTASGAKSVFCVTLAH